MQQGKLSSALRIILFIGGILVTHTTEMAYAREIPWNLGVATVRDDTVSTTILHEFDWIVTKVTTNYSGYRDKVHDKTAFDCFTDSIRVIASHAGSLKESIPLFESWLKLFRDSHLSIRWKKGLPGTVSKYDSIRARFDCKQLDKRTTLLVLPSFNIRYKQLIDSLIEANKYVIRSSTNLIVDIRNNGGGSDESYNKLLPFLYTNPLIRINSDIWSTNDNIKKYESVAADTHYSPETRKTMKALVEKLRHHVGHFVSKENDDALRLPIVDSLPARIIVAINDKVASSAEGFLLQAIQSKKVVLAGQHSKGELDYANVYYMDSPSHQLTLGCPTSRSRRLPESPIDNIGVQPNVVLTLDKDWIDYIAQRVDDYEFSPARFSTPNTKRASSSLSWKEKKDTSAVNFALLANSIIGSDCRSTVDSVRRVVEWTNSNFKWTFTDYKNRTVKEIIIRGGGNCSEQTRVTKMLLTQLGIKTRSMCEINIQPEDKGRQTRAEAKVKESGNKLSVFGLNHNDHVWIEFFDEADGRWEPADPTLGLVGVESWLIARISFAPRPTHAIIPSRDMIVPIGLFVRDDQTGTIRENRSEFYLIDQFNLAYGGRLAKLNEWNEWTRLIRTVSPKCREAFEGTTNLHGYSQEIIQIRMVYEKLRNKFER